MTRLAALAVLCCVTSHAVETERVEKRNAAGNVVETYTLVDKKRAGPSVSYHDNGQKSAEATYVDGHIQGSYVSYHSNGKVAVQTSFDQGRFSGQWLEYHPNGQLKLQGTVAGSQKGWEDTPKLEWAIRTGTWVAFDANGIKREEMSYGADNLFHGPLLQFHANGSRSLETAFDKGNLTGQWSEYHANGKLSRQGTMSGSRKGFHNTPDFTWGTRTGKWVDFDAEGVKRQEMHYGADNLFHGPFLQFHADGSRSFETTFDNGQLKGLWSEYHPNGQLKRQGAMAGSQKGFHNTADFTWGIKTGPWLSFDSTGKLTNVVNYADNQVSGTVAYATDPDTGKTKISVSNPDGTRTVTEVDRNGLPATATAEAPAEAADIVAMQTDPKTGQTSTVRRNPDGTTSTYQGFRTTDPDGTERFTETDDKGRRIETLVAPDGTLTVVKSNPGEGETRTITRPDGRVSTIERDPAGRTKTSHLAEDGSLISEVRDPGGKLVATLTQKPDGWKERVDAHGNRRSVKHEPDGSTITVTTDRSGNVTTTTTDRDGKVIASDSNIIAPTEPGRDYFERVLKGTDWDDVPQSLKTRYAASEQELIDVQARRAQEDAVNARAKVEAAERAAADQAGNEELERKLAAIKAEQEQADRIAARRAAQAARKAEIQQSYETSRDLQRQYDDAINRGDKTEAMRIMEKQDEHHAKATELLRHTPEELQEMERHADERATIAARINQAAHAGAAERIAADEALQSAKETVTMGTQVVSIGSQMQQATKAATRAANREKALAQSKQREIERLLADPATTPSQRQILQEMQELAVLQETGAGEMLAANARITTAGYAVDAAMVLTGGKVFQAGAKGIQTAAGAVRTAITKRATVEASTAGTTSMAGRTTLALTDDVAKNSATLLESRASTSMDQASRIVGRDVLPSPPAPSTSMTFTPSELAHLHRPGANLTGAEIIKKGELYAQWAALRQRVRTAIENGVPESVLVPIRQEYVRLNQLINQGRAAGGQ